MLFTSSIEAVAHLLYPSICSGCKRNEVSSEDWLCLECLLSLPYTGFENIRNNPVEQFFWGRTSISFACSTFFYVEKTPLQLLIHEVKYKEQQALGIWLGTLMGSTLKSIFELQSVDLMLPMPLHRNKEKQRGYNQSTLLCKGIKSATGCSYEEHLLIRNTNTSTQTKKSRIDRWENVQHVFSVHHPENIKNKHICLIDDVITTGASTEACASLLLQNGAQSVSVCSLAYTL